MTRLSPPPQEVLATNYKRLGRTPPALLSTLDEKAVFTSIEARKRQREGSSATATDFVFSVARPTADKDAGKAALHAQITAPALVKNAQGIFHQALASVRR